MEKDRASKARRIPQATLTRLPIYLRYLHELLQSGTEFISSSELAELAGGNGPQLRKDLSFLGEFGTRGVGYQIGPLAFQISEFMGLNRTRRVAVIGVGRLGTALIKYKGFADKGFLILSAFDPDLKKIGHMIEDIKIEGMDRLKEVLKEKDITICIIATPASRAQEVMEVLIQAGIKAVLNFAPVSLKAPKDVTVRQIDIAIELQILSFMSELSLK